MKQKENSDQPTEPGRPTKEYSHELNTEVRSISGGYSLDEEGGIDIEGREVLYAVGNAAVDSTCCGVYGCRFAVVPGYVVKWKYKKNLSGVFVSEVEPIRDHLAKRQIEEILRGVKGVTQVVFW